MGDNVVHNIQMFGAQFSVHVLVLVLNKDHVTIKRMLAPKGIRIPGLHSYVSVYNLTQEKRMLYSPPASSLPKYGRNRIRAG